MLDHRRWSLGKVQVLKIPNLKTIDQSEGRPHPWRGWDLMVVFGVSVPSLPPEAIRGTVSTKLWLATGHCAAGCGRAVFTKSLRPTSEDLHHVPKDRKDRLIADLDRRFRPQFGLLRKPAVAASSKDDDFAIFKPSPDQFGVG